MVYLACVFIIGVPVLCAEFVMGRGTHKNVRGAFKQLHSSRLWHFCSYTGIPMAIGFKAPFLIDLLGSITSADVLLKLADPARAGLLLPAENEENEDVLMLLMPMLLND